MRIIATSLLGAMAAGWLVSSILVRQYPALAWLQAATEAGVVGGLADWFAVVALFRHPFGLPIPHTAIIPRKKDRIGLQLGQFVERNFLTPENIRVRLGAVDAAGFLIRWLGRPSNAGAVAATVGQVVPRILAALDDGKIERELGRRVLDGLGSADAPSIAARLLRLITAEGHHRPILDTVIRSVGGWLDRNRETLKERFGGRSRFTPRWVDGYIVNRFIDTAVELVGEVVSAPTHEVRDAFDGAIAEFIEGLETDPAMRARAAALQGDLIEMLRLETLGPRLWREIKAQLAQSCEGSPAPIETALTELLLRLARELRRDRAMAERINKAMIALGEITLGRLRHTVSVLIAEVVQRWDPRDVALRIEREVGRDLQFIRVNGTLVGAAAGILLHAIVVTAMARF